MPDTFTPEQISQILEEFFKVVGTRQYIGARYVPLFGRKDEDSIEWDNTAPYEPLTIVLYQGNSYTSRQFVPVGVEITNQEFWALTGNYNAQIEQYRREVQAISEQLTSISDSVDTISDALPIDSFGDVTVKDYVDSKFDSIPTIVSDYSELLSSTDSLVYVLKNDGPLGDGRACLFETTEQTTGSIKRADNTYVVAVAQKDCNYSSNAPSVSLPNVIASYIGLEDLPYGQGQGPFNRIVNNMVDCSSFVWLCLGGIDYNNSRLVLGSDADNIYGSYVGKNRISTTDTPYPGYIGALPTYWSVEYFAEQHQLFAFEDGVNDRNAGRRNVNKLQFGDILFSASGTYPDHIHGIDHCMMVVETFPDDNAVLIAESGGAPHTIRTLQSTNCKLAYVNLGSYSGPNGEYKFFARPSYNYVTEDNDNLGYRFTSMGLQNAVPGSSSVVLGRLYNKYPLKAHHFYSILVNGKLPVDTDSSAYLYISYGGSTVTNLWHLDLHDSAYLVFIPTSDVPANSTMAIVANCTNTESESHTFEIESATIVEGIANAAFMCRSIQPQAVDGLTHTISSANMYIDGCGCAYLEFILTLVADGETGDVQVLQMPTGFSTNSTMHFYAGKGDTATEMLAARYRVASNTINVVIPTTYTAGAHRFHTYLPYINME